MRLYLAHSVFVAFVLLSGLLTSCPCALAQNRTSCRFASGLTVGDREQELRCCNVTYDLFSRKWATGSAYLSTLLESLRGWNCPQYQQECHDQTFAYNTFTRLMYSRFCDHEKLEEKCTAEVRQTVEYQSATNIAILTWSDAVRSLNVLDLNNDQLASPCVQVAMYERENGGHGHYHEVIQPLIPFCSFIWCGYDEQLVAAGRVTTWTCMPQRCRTNIIVISVFCVILAIIIFICNATVMLVLGGNRNMWFGQGVYRFSLAFADLLAGIIVFPTFVSTLLRYLAVDHNLGDLRNVTGYVVAETGNRTDEISLMLIRDPSNTFSDAFPRSYLDFVGFFTVLSLSVSIYTLVSAAFDRFVAIVCPQRYKQKSAFVTACFVSLVLWILGIIFASLPFYIRTLRYTVVNSILISSSGPGVPALYAVAFILPLILMWLVTIATFIASRHLTRAWADISEEWRKVQGQVELRLALTLAIMVGVFTLSILPSIIVLLLVEELPDVYYNDPKNLNQQSAINLVSAELVIMMLLMCNSLWNCFIYSVRDREFRKSAGKMYASAAKIAKLTALYNRIRGGSGITSRHGDNEVSPYNHFDSSQHSEETRIAREETKVDDTAL
ncbi:uncharacterized protein LOC143445492 [Clavelina lepadiformis]|uniref:G-protein coupled receptors family 1 profile domain-containing protein n=1 Tax=Clavelina lepadiformis TaxID=159417 RepID=A0ABP0GSG4_CLALP